MIGRFDLLISKSPIRAGCCKIEIRAVAIATTEDMENCAIEESLAALDRRKGARERIHASTG
jgi:hypothetical protein